MNPLHIWLEVCVHLEPILSSNEVNFQESRYIYLKSGINLLQWSCSLSPGKVKLIKHQKKLQVQTVTRRISVVQSFLFFSFRCLALLILNFLFIFWAFTVYTPQYPFGQIFLGSTVSIHPYGRLALSLSLSLSLTFVKVINYK